MISEQAIAAIMGTAFVFLIITAGISVVAAFMSFLLRNEDDDDPDS